MVPARESPGGGRGGAPKWLLSSQSPRLARESLEVKLKLLTYVRFTKILLAKALHTEIRSCSM